MSMIHGKKDRRPTISSQMFGEAVKKAFTNGGTTKDVADQLGMTAVGVAQRITQWQKKGIHIPSLPGVGHKGGGHKLKVDALNELFADMPVNVEPTPKPVEPVVTVQPVSVVDPLEAWAAMEDDGSLEAPLAENMPAKRRKKKGKDAA